MIFARKMSEFYINQSINQSIFIKIARKFFFRILGGRLLRLTLMRTRIRGNNNKLIQHHCRSHHYDLRKLSFTNRVIPIWNTLSNRVVSADTINTFKNRLDTFWFDQGSALRL